jgi:NADH-quinone oxidoreductase subunit L
MINLVWLIPVFPLLGFLIIGLANRKLSKGLTGAIGSGSILGSFLIVLSLLIPMINGSLKATTITYFDWITVGNFNIPFAFLIDPLSVTMMTIITGVGFLIHVYSIGYMHDDDGFRRYFSYLNLFVFSMLLLVMGANYLVLFTGWEGVGLCSYLLIGFWFKNQNYNSAAKKAFIMNRIGDLAFLLGMLLITKEFGTLDYDFIFKNAPDLRPNATMATVITLLLFIGATGKSAQIPLYTWLPDAMAGPTPVSALIHAATMVTAGVYMIVRSNVLYTLAPVTLDVILVIGLATALFAGTIALVQNDIKKVLAYSTVSQLGFMFFALGLGAYSTAIFHLATHAFFKALLFLAAGSVIHAMSGEQDIRNMGDLKKYLPVTFWTFIIATLAISGIPPFAGFFSKDEILAHAYERSPLLWGLGLIGALMTTFYMFRLVFLTFFGGFRGNEHQKSHLHESPMVMTVPLMVLALLSVVGGFIGIPEVLHGGNFLKEFLSPVIKSSLNLPAEILSHSTEMGLMIASVAAVLIVIGIAWFIYVSKHTLPQKEEETLSAPHKILYGKYFIDEIYQVLIVKPVYWLSHTFYSVLEIKGIDRVVNGVGKGINRGSGFLRFSQPGNMNYYLLMMVAGIIAILVFNEYFIDLGNSLTSNLK